MSEGPSPQAAGSMALLLSAAKQAGKDAAPAALRQAVYSSAAFNPDVPAFLQGNGQINTSAAWALLAQGLQPDTFSVQAPVCTEIWQLLGRTTGTGLYNRCAPDRGGAVAGVKRSYPITVTRSSGAPTAGPHRLSLQGDDGTFSLEAAPVRLPLNRAVPVAVTTRPAERAHSALLRLDSEQSAGLDAEVMLAVVASPTLSAPTFGGTITEVAKRNEAQRYYLTVPPGAKALQVQMPGPAAGSQTRFLAFHPYGLSLDDTSTISCYSNYPLNACDPGLQQSPAGCLGAARRVLAYIAVARQPVRRDGVGPRRHHHAADADHR